MDIQNNNNKETATQNEQQLKTKIIDSVIAILAENNLSISESKEVLYMASKRLELQKVTTFL